MNPNRPNVFAVVIFIGAAVALACFFQAAGHVKLIPSTGAATRAFELAAPLVFVILYARLVANALTTKRQRVVATLSNCGGATVAALFLLLVPRAHIRSWEPSTTGLVIVILAPVVWLVFASAMIITRKKFAHAVGTLTAVLTWPYFAWIVLRTGDISRYADRLETVSFFLSFTSPFVLVFGSVALLSYQRLGYITGLVAALMGLWWLAWTELIRFVMANSWIALNLSEEMDLGLVLTSKLKILSVGLLLTAVACCAVRLMPTHWMWRESPLYTRTWPAFSVCALVLAVWFGCAVIPYRIPVIVDGPWPDLRMLRVEKRGLQFHETAISATRDGRFWISTRNRRLFQYRFKERTAQAQMPLISAHRMLDLIHSPQLEDLNTPPAKALRAWNADGWYIVAPGVGSLAFTTEYGNAPPREVVDLFHELEELAPKVTRESEAKDVCLGFCYDPPAGLGIQYVNQRCRTDSSGTRCW